MKKDALNGATDPDANEQGSLLEPNGGVQAMSEKKKPGKKKEGNVTLGAYFALLRERPDFCWFTTSSCITVLSEYMTLIANVHMIENFQTGSRSSLYISAYAVIKQLCGIFSSILIGGPIADSKDRRKTMVRLNCISIFLALLNFIPLYFRSVIGVYLVVASYQVVYGIYQPVRGTILPTMFKGEKLKFRMATVANMTLVQGVMAPIGSACGGFIVTYLGLKACFLLDSFTFFLSAVMLSMMEGDYAPEQKESTDKSVFHRAERMVREGFAYCREQFWGALVLFRGAIGFQAGSMTVLMASFATNLPGNSTLNLSYLYLTLGLGSFLGPISGSRWPTLCDSQFVGILGLMLIFCGIFGMGVTDVLLNTILSVCIFNVIRASGTKIAGVNSRLLLNRFSENSMMGRVMSIDYVVCVMMGATGATLAGVLEDNVGLSSADSSFVIAGIIVMMVLGWIIYHGTGHGAASPEALPFDKPSKKETLALTDGVDNDGDAANTIEEPSKNTRKLVLFFVAGILVSVIGIIFAIDKELQSSVVAAVATIAIDNTTLSESSNFPIDAKLSDFGF